MRNVRSALALTLLAGSVVSAQTPQRMVTRRIDDGSAHHRSEMALRVSKSTFDVLAVWHQHPAYPDTNVYYNSSIDGSAFRSSPVRIALPSAWVSAHGSYDAYQGADPMVAFADDGTGYVGYVGADYTATFWYERFWVAQKDAGVSLAGEAVPVVRTGTHLDKGVLAAGPLYGATSDELTIACAYDTSWNHLRLLSMPDPATSSSDDPIGIGTNREDEGGPNASEILRGGLRNGRWVLAYHNHYYVNNVLVGNRPRAVYNDGDIYGWQLAVHPTKARVHGTTSGTETFNPVLAIPSHASTGPDILNTPGMAVDPRPLSSTADATMYMVFMAMPEGTSNIELYIAQSTDSGANFSGTTVTPHFLGERVLRLREEEDLGDPAGSVQFLPSITVDNWGGVHVLYYVGRYDTSAAIWKYKVKLATIPSFSTGDPAVSTIELTPEFDLEHSTVWGYPSNPRFIGHYMNTLDSRGCQLYAGYIARDPNEDDSVGVYVSMVLNPNSECAPDENCWVNCDGSTDAPIVNIADFVCFMERFAAGETWANCDGSTTSPVLNVLDFNCFINRYSAGCE
jgi:hypothetical protein